MLTLDQPRITARCHFCTRRFTASPAADGGPMLEDNRGELCCDDCLCRCCGSGHVTAADFEACAEDAADHYGEDYDDIDYYTDPFEPYQLPFTSDLEMSS
jgi:hypothetical protein